ncbi:MAG TPA: hypothetical protein DD685_13645 [Halomonas sp.]|nr:hypothetical protein [Halomonas sp.]|tara:strand:+ start:2317 stop:2664 length:348 start_codon:yes stop_codon:yes gene_type:complete
MKKDDTYRSQFRLPYDLYEKLKAESEKNRRSLNAEIVARLDKSLEGQSPSHGEDSVDEESFSADDVLLMYRELDTAVKNIQRLRASREKFLNRHDSKNEKKGGSGKVDIEDDLLK